MVDNLRHLSFSPVPQVPYYIKIAAYTVKGRGPYSDPVVNFTMEGGILTMLLICLKITP